MKKSVNPKWSTGRLLVAIHQADSELLVLRLLTQLYARYPEHCSPKCK